MNQKFNIKNQKSDEFELIRKSEVVDKLLGDLDSIALESSLVETDLSVENSASNSSYVPPQGLYIVEIEDQFSLLDYTRETYETKPEPLTASNLIKSPHPEKINAALSSNQNSNSKSVSSLGKKGLWLGVGLGVLLTLGVTRLLAPQTNASKGEPELVSESIAPAKAVTVTEVITTDIDSTLNVSGTVAAYERTPVMSQAAGLQITEMLVERGDAVKQGQVLARLNNRVLSAEKVQAEGAVNQAQARLDELEAGSRAEEIAQAESRVANAQSAIAEASSNLELVRKRVQSNIALQAEGAISRDALDELLSQERVAESSLAGEKADLNEAQQALAQLRAGSRPQIIAQAQAELAQAKGRLQGITAQLAGTSITAPRSGIIADRQGRVGQITSTSETLFSIIQDGRLELSLQIPETLIGKIQPGQKVQITSNRIRDLALTGKVREIEPLIDTNTRQGTVKVALPVGTNLKPGMFLQAIINTDTNQGQAVPIAALLPQSGNTAIAFVLQEDNIVKAQQVKTGEILSEQRVEVIEGLQPGDRIVLKGAAYLKDGDKVAISKEQVSSIK